MDLRGRTGLRTCRIKAASKRQPVRKMMLPPRQGTADDQGGDNEEGEKPEGVAPINGQPVGRQLRASNPRHAGKHVSNHIQAGALSRVMLLRPDAHLRPNR